MSDETNSLKLPFLISSQADKHVTMNQSLQKLDHVLMACVTEHGQNTPPNTLLEGQKVLVGTQPTGAFTGHNGALAMWLIGEWHFAAPQSGWIVYLTSEQKYLIYDGGAWVDLGSKLGAVQNVSMLGLGTAADAGNPFSVKLNSALWTAKAQSEGGTGDLRLVLNKSSSNQVGSLLFQSNYSGRAEFGLVGTDSFSMRVSGDGANWTTALSVESNGRLGLPRGLQGRLDLPSTVPDGQAHVSQNGVRLLTLRAPAGCVGENLFLGESAGVLTAAGAGQEASFNTGIGASALSTLTTGYGNTAVGHTAAKGVTTGLQNTAIGSGALFQASAAVQNAAMGHAALYSTTTGSGNTGLGLYALFSNSVGTWNTAIGAYSLMYQVDGSPNTSFVNCSGLGTDARVSGSNQVQLGSSATTVYAYGSVQNRSDPRDKADIRPTQLGLKFILALEPVDFRWDYRDAYFDPAKTVLELDHAPQTQPKQVQRDGTKKRKRFHHGLNAEQVHHAMMTLGVDFGGYQDHKLQGGSDVKTIGYCELIGPIIKAIHELHCRIEKLEQAS